MWPVSAGRIVDQVSSHISCLISLCYLGMSTKPSQCPGYFITVIEMTFSAMFSFLTVVA